MTRPEHLHYDKVEAWFRESIAQGRDFLFDTTLFDIELRRLWEEYNFPYESLVSFVRNLHVLHVKRTAHKVKANLSLYMDEYKNGTCTIRQLAQRANYPPALFARFVVEQAVMIRSNSNSSSSSIMSSLSSSSSSSMVVTEAMRNPATILSNLDNISPEFHAAEAHQQMTRNAAAPRTTMTTTTRLAREVMEAIDSDPLHGPLHERERHFVGVEYEVVLEYQLKSLNLPFETEKQLQERGTSRTPDILLTCPLAIKLPNNNNNNNNSNDDDGSFDNTDNNNNNNNNNCKVICWIDSKALFGDENTHQTSVLPQAQSYVHRFGPGLVLYWFGHAPLNRLGDCQGDIVICGWQLPSAFMLPTGEKIVRKQQTAQQSKQIDAARTS